MKISVIVPVYNVEDYICECIDSVLSQTYKDYELILVDDGSSDNSGVICDTYQEQKSEQIIVIHTSNSGVLHARLQGIEKANGELLVFLDSDDCLRVDALEQIEKCFEMHQCDMVIFDAGDCDKFPTMHKCHDLSEGIIFDDSSRREIYRNLLLGNVPNSVCLKAFRKECAVFPDYFSEFRHVKHGEDLLMSVYMITNSKKGVYLPEELYYYRIRLGSAVNSYSPLRFASVKTVHNEIANCIDRWNMPELKPIHCRRKVKGCVDNLLLLYQHRSEMPKANFREQLTGISEDPYFLTAYAGMEQNKLGFFYGFVADCLKNKKYILLSAIMLPKQFVRKMKSALRSKHVR